MNKPQIKPMLLPHINEEKTGIHFGGFQEGISRDIIVDNPKQFYKFILSLDGEHSINQLSDKFDLPLIELLEILKSLRENGLIYENDPSGLNFSNEELLFYNRNLNYFAWIDTEGYYYNYWHTQLQLKNARVLLLGAGGSGSNCADALVRMGIGTLFIVDKDNIEISNLNRQLYYYEDVGTKKVETLSNRLKKTNPFVKIIPKVASIQSLSDIESLGTDFDIVINCIDSPLEFPNVLDAYTNKYKTPWILGGYASTIVNHALFDGSTKGFLELLEETNSQDFNAREVDNQTTWTWKNAVISPIAVMSGTLSALYCCYYITNLVNIKPGKTQHIDLFNLQDLQNFSYIL